jgi:protein SCO1/2
LVEHTNEQVTRRSFFRAPAFWTGNLLWLVVIVTMALGWNQKPRVHSAPPAAGEGETKPAITITTDKDGNAKVTAPGENPESPWDPEGIADFSFINTDGKKVTRADLLGKPWIVCFVFTHCALTCPTVTNSMRDLQDQLKDYDFRLVTLTVDPGRDTPEVLKGYGESRGADFSKWMFLGGDQRDIYRLIHGSFKMPVKELPVERRKQGFEFIHSNNIMLVDEKGVVRGKFDATNGVQVAALRREIQKIATKSGPARGAKKTPE